MPQKNKSVSLGLDLGSRFIKLTALQWAGGGPNIALLDREAVPQDAFRGGVCADPDAVGRACAVLVARAGLRRGGMQVGIGVGNVHFRWLELPRMTAAETAEAVRFEAAELFPMPLPELVLDHATVGITPDGRQQIFLAAVPKDTVGICLRALARARIEAAAVDVDLIAAYRSWLRWGPANDDPAGAVALLDLGDAGTRLGIFAGPAPVLNRTIPITVGQMAAHLAALENGTPQSVIERWEAGALERDELARQQLTELLGDLAAEVNRSIQFYHFQHDARVRQLVLVGGWAALPGLGAALEAALQMARGAVTGDLQPLRVAVGNHPAYAAALGLALREEPA